MKFKSQGIFILLSCLFITHNISATDKKSVKTKPKVCILATGGTIAGAQSGKSAYGYQSVSFKVEDLSSAVPTMKDLANIS